MKRFFVPFYLILSLLAACSQLESPHYLMPSLRIEEAQEITRTTALLTGEVTLHGDGEVTQLCFRYGVDEEMKQKALCDASLQLPSVMVSKLLPDTCYYYCLEAGNGTSKVQSAVGVFKTLPYYRPQSADLLQLNRAGTLEEAIAPADKYQFSILGIVGEMNGNDFRFLRDMMGRDANGNRTEGNLKELNLSRVNLRSGGTSYDGMHYTKEQTITQGLFSQCSYLEVLQLPDEATIVEENAFKGCVSLCKLQLPSKAVKIVPSQNCPQLTEIEINIPNDRFASREGVLYNADLSTLVWFPEGKEELGTLPSTLTRIGAYAFQYSRIKELVLPDKIKEIGQGAFYQMQVERLTLPAALQTLPNGLLQDCSMLRSLTLGKNTSYLADYCFEGCRLQELHVLTEDLPPYCEKHCFDESLYQNCQLYVPANLRNKYVNHPVWGKFKQIKAL